MLAPFGFLQLITSFLFLVFRPATVATVPLSDELKGSLRSMKPKGNLLEEHVGRMATTSQVNEKKKQKKCVFAYFLLPCTMVVQRNSRVYFVRSQALTASWHEEGKAVRKIQISCPSSDGKSSFVNSTRSAIAVVLRALSSSVVYFWISLETEFCFLNEFSPHTSAECTHSRNNRRLKHISHAALHSLAELYAAMGHN